ncbi:hypothetical protein LINPERHAP1_LOCUS12714 [Linum perenne]
MRELGESELHRSFTGVLPKGGCSLLQIKEDDGRVAFWSPKFYS